MINENLKLSIDKIYEKLLKDKGIILLDNANKEESREIFKLSTNYPEMIVFNIGKAEDKKIVFRYKTKSKDYIDIKKLLRDGNEFYSNKNYDECLKNYLEVLSFGFPKGFVYGRIGLCYLKKGNKEKALDYLIVSDYICKQENDTYDFSNLIIKLKNELNNTTKKEETNTKKNVDNYYGIENIEEIINHILNSNSDIRTVCNSLGMTEEQTNILILLFARDFYSEGYYCKGDYYLKLVEKTKNKTKNVNKLLEEIRKNKKFYINRPTEESKQIVLKLQSQKH